MWKRCLEGQTLSGGLCEGTPVHYNWAEAFVAAEAATFAGHSDRRLPNPKELLSVFEDRCSEPALNAELFPIPGNFSMWTATPSALLFLDLYNEAWLFDGFGVQRRDNVLSSRPILLVRDTQ